MTEQSTDQTDAGARRDERQAVADGHQREIAEHRPAAGDDRACHAGLGVVVAVARHSKDERRKKDADETENHAEHRHESAEDDADRRERERDEEDARREQVSGALAERRVPVGRARRALLAPLGVGRGAARGVGALDFREEFVGIAGFRAFAVGHTEIRSSSGMDLSPLRMGRSNPTAKSCATLSHTVSVRLETPLEIGGLGLKNRLYRAPLLECAGDGPEAVDRLIAELEPAAAAGAGLICQGAMPVRREGGRVAPNMTSLAEPPDDLCRLTDAVHDHGARIFAQLDHGGIRSLETWHRAYREEHPHLRQLAVSEPPIALKLAERARFLRFDFDVLSTGDVYDLAADFGRCAERAIAVGYDGIHLAGANMGIIQQFLSPYYNRRTDEFGGSFDERIRFLSLVHDEIRKRIGNVPLMSKVPSEASAPPGVRPRLSTDDGVAIARRLDSIGFDAVVPVRGSTFWDMSIVRGEYPERAWSNSSFRDGYAAAFGSRWRARLVALANRAQASQYGTESAWNADFCCRVRGVVSIPVLCEGGIRRRSAMDRLLGSGCDMVGMGRPFYAEPRLPARLLDVETSTDPRAVCESCNNCTVP